MKARNLDFKVIITTTRPTQAWKRTNMRMNLEMIEKKVSDCLDVFAPTILKPILGAMVAMLSETRLPQTKIKYEYFYGYLGAPGGKSRQ